MGSRLSPIFVEPDLANDFLSVFFWVCFCSARLYRWHETNSDLDLGVFSWSMFILSSCLAPPNLRDLRDYQEGRLFCLIA